MKLLIAVGSLKLGGTERVVSRLADWMVSRGHEVSLYTKSPPERDFYQVEASVRRVFDTQLTMSSEDQALPVRVYRAVRRVLGLRAMIRDVSPDVIVSFSDHINVRILIASRFTGAPVVISERNNPHLKSMRPGWHAMRCLLYRYATAVVFPSADMLPLFPYIKEQCAFVIHNPVSPTETIQDDSSSAISENLLSQLLSASDSTRIMLAMGRLDQQKGFDLLISAIERLVPKYPNLHMVILGEGSERDRLTMIAADRGVDKHLHLPGAVKDPPFWFRHAEVFVLSSRYEGFPNALLEAMAAGLPVVATDCPTGPREIVHDNENGLLVPPENEEAMATAMDKLLQDEQLRLRLGKRARTDVMERFGVDKVFGSWEQLIRQVKVVV